MLLKVALNTITYKYILKIVLYLMFILTTFSTTKDI